MTSAHVNSVVRLKEHLPAHRLRCGDVGVVVSAWLSTGDLLFEVEFHNSARSPAVRALLRAEQLEVIESEPLRQLVDIRSCCRRNRRRNPGGADQVEREL